MDILNPARNGGVFYCLPKKTICLRGAYAAKRQEKRDSTLLAESLTISGARDENRTRTPIRARDFKSLLIPKDIISLDLQDVPKYAVFLASIIS